MQKLTPEQRDWLIEQFKKTINPNYDMINMRGSEITIMNFCFFADIEQILNQCTEDENVPR